MRDGVLLVRLGSQPYGADDDRSDLVGATMTRRAQPETQIQRAVIEHIAWRARPGVFAFHVPNGGWRSRVEGAILKAIGTVAGVPDIICIFQGRRLRARAQSRARPPHRRSALSTSGCAKPAQTSPWRTESTRHSHSSKPGTCFATTRQVAPARIRRQPR